MSTREAIIDAALSYVGTPFHHQARLPGPEGGIDCAGVVVCAHRHAGLKVHDFLVYNRRANPRVLLEHLDQSFREILEDEAGPGDVALFFYRRRRDGEPMPQHLAQLVEKKDSPSGLGLLHAYEEQRDRYSEVQLIDFDQVWRERLYAFYRHRGVE